MRNWISKAVVIATLTIAPLSARAADVTASLGSNSISVGETTSLSFYLDQLLDESISAFDAQITLMGDGATIPAVNRVPDPLTIGDTWTVDQNVRFDSGVVLFSLSSDNIGGQRLLAEMEIFGVAPGEVSLVLTQAAASMDIDVPPFSEPVPINNIGQMLASITVVPEPSTFALVFLGLATLAAGRGRPSRTA